MFFFFLKNNGASKERIPLPTPKIIQPKMLKKAPTMAKKPCVGVLFWLFVLIKLKLLR